MSPFEASAKIKRCLKEFVIGAFACYGLLWTVVESVGAFFSSIKPEGISGYACLVVPALIVGFYRALPSRSITLKIPNSDSELHIEFGDIFEKDGCIAIQVNEFFDSILGDHVSESSLHGQFIRNVLGGQSLAFDTLVSKALEGEHFEQIDRQSGNTKMYQIGTTASIDVNSHRYLLFALARTDINTLKASATVHELWDALAGLWVAVRIKSNGHPVSMPLVGGGLSGVGLPAINLLQIVITSFSYYTKKNKITGRLNIVLHSQLAGDIDLDAIKQQWRAA